MSLHTARNPFQARNRSYERKYSKANEKDDDQKSQASAIDLEQVKILNSNDLTQNNRYSSKNKS